MTACLSSAFWTLQAMNSLRTYIAKFLRVLAAVFVGTSIQAEDLTQLIGNGSLTLGFDSSGRIASLQWPSPGYYSQLSSRADDDSDGPRGIQWGLDIGGRIEWVGGEGWSLTRFEEVRRGGSVALSYRHEALGIEVDQTFGVDREEDILQASILVRGIETPRLVWYADLDPTTQLMRLRKGRDGAESGLSDFACVVNENAKQIVHFRVRGAGSKVRESAERWIVEGGDYSAWAGLGEGTWIAYTSEQHIVQLSTGLVEAGITELLKGSTRASLGNTHSLMVLEAEIQEDGAYAAVRVGFAGEGDTVEALLLGNSGLSSKKTDVSTETLQFRRFRPNRFNLDDVAAELFSKLEVMTDTDSGSLITNLHENEYPYVVSTLEASYCVYALGLAKSTYRAEKLLDFLLDGIYESPDGSVPLGSVPALVFANGEAASVHYEVDLLAAASLIWGTEAYGRTTERRLQRDFYRSHWDSVELMADFLEHWVQPLLRIRAKVLASDPSGLEAMTRDIASVYLGLEHAIRIAWSAGYQVPETWNRTRQRCYVYMKGRNLSVFAPWDIEFGFPKGEVIRTADFPNRGALKAFVGALEPFELVYLFTSLGYQHRSARQLPFSLRGVIDGELEDLLTSDITGYSSGRIAIFLSMLHQSYH